MFYREQGQIAVGVITFCLSRCLLLDHLASVQPGRGAGQSQAHSRWLSRAVV